MTAMARTTPVKAALAALALAGAASAQTPCRTLTDDGRSHVACTVTAGQDLRLFLRDGTGTILGSFARIDSVLRAEGRKLGFAMNAGMYHPDRRPVGLYVENGIRITPLVTSAGPGNFGLRPNGVFCIRPDGTFAVIESRAFAETRQSCRHASQSGPMLVIDGALHPRFLAESPSRFVRNGVGVSRDGKTAVFVIANDPVNFHEFASLFRDRLGLPDALYFDGNISRLHAPDLARSDFGFPMGPVVGLVVPD